ncbi:CAP domain-containing protein [Myxococcota bacterium]|nr:CAP domain-containing protein [Myxococcota bacterium]MBU1538084.1 CAP domain-containing protein [Myxococcota bacterium]
MLKQWFVYPLTLISLLLLVSSCDDGGGQGKSSLTAEEQVVLDLVNYARTDPQGFAEDYLLSAYNSGTDNGAYDDLMSLDPVQAVSIHGDLLDAAYAHSLDMANNCQSMQHDSCDGTTWSDRIFSYYSGGTIGENIAWGFSTGESVVIAWIIDQGISSLGHRRNILSGSYVHMGIAQVGSYWTQDFGAGGK